MNLGPIPTAGPDDVRWFVRTQSHAAESAIDQCDFENPLCVADALDRYAAALRQIAPQLPPQLRSLPDVVQTAARRVRASRTREEAVRAVAAAIAVVHKSIALLKADDGFALRVQTREGALVAETLEVASNKLESAVGL